MVALKQYFWVIHLGLITLVVYVGADLFWAIVGSRMEPDGHVLTLSQSTEVQVQEKRSFAQYAIIEERNLFSSKGRAATPTPKPPAPAPAKTALNLKLVGTVVGGSAYTYAIIEDLNAKKQDLYRLGDLIQGAKILEITRNRVVLDNGGRPEELLTFEKREASTPSAEAVPRQLSARRALPPPGGPPPKEREQAQGAEGEAGGAEVQKVNENTWQVSREELSEQFGNLNRLLTEARMTPHFTSGQPDGFMITNIVKNSFLERIGLRNGDVLKGINGQILSNMDEVLRAYQQLQNEPVLRLDVERGNRTETLTYEVR